MNAPTIEARFNVEENSFSQKVNELALVSGRTIEEEFKNQGKLLAAELIKRTPPFSGQSIVRMLGAQGKTLRDVDIEEMTALQIGKRRVEKDIRKVIYGVKGASMEAAGNRPERLRDKTGQFMKDEAQLDWGVIQKCEGKEAVRVFATKGGVVYGVDRERFVPMASMAEMQATHEEHRTKRGRVTTAGQKTKDIGRWRWLNVLVTAESAVREFIVSKCNAVGQGKGGWAEAFIQLGGRMSRSGWVGKHAARAGTYQGTFTRGNISISITNNSKWAKGGDPERIIAKSMEGREKAIEGNIEHQIEELWKENKIA